MHTNPVGDQDSLLDFDIYLQHTNANVSDSFNYAGGQFYFNFNLGIAPLGSLTLIKTGSDLPPQLQCIFFAVTGVQLRCATNTPNNLDYIVSSIFPGTKVLSLRLKTSAHSWNFSTANIEWRTALPNPFTKFSYNVSAGIDSVIDNVNGTFVVEDNSPLPVELSTFSARVSRNNVTLNWSTTQETNNAGFDIERKTSNSVDWTKIGSIMGNGTTNDTKSYSLSDRATGGTYFYRLKQKDYNGNSQYYNLKDEVKVGIPTSYELSQNYPNPFNPATKIDFDLPIRGKVNIVLYDVSGRQVETMIDKIMDAGYYTVQYNASNLSSGIYFYRLTVLGNNTFVNTKKMAVIK